MYPVKLPAESPLLTLTHPQPHIWIIELQNGEDNRLTEHFILNAINPALDIVENQWRGNLRNAKENRADKEKQSAAGALIFTGKQSQQKFFSNGFDFSAVLKKPYFITSTFDPLMVRLLSFPVPLISAINGHVFAAGFSLALSCDFRVMTSGKAWACMNEIHFGASLPHSFVVLFRTKVANPNTLRKILLMGHRFTPEELLAESLVDELASPEMVLAAAINLAGKVAGNARTGVWGLIKREIYKDAIEACGGMFRQVSLEEEDERFRQSLLRTEVKL